MQQAIEIQHQIKLGHVSNSCDRDLVIKKASEDIPEAIVQFIKKCAIDHQLFNCDVSKTASGVKGDGYLGVVTFIKVNGYTKNNEKRTMDIVVKCAHTGEALRSKMPINEIFAREITMYTKVLPEVLSFQQDCRIKNVFSGFTNCLHWSKENDHEALLLQNIKTLGFGLYDRKEHMDHNHLEIVLKEYAKYHAASFAMKKKNTEKWNYITDGLGNIFDGYLDEFVPMYESCLLGVAKLFEDQDSVEYKQLIKFKNNLSKDLYKFHNEMDEFSVILHGDCWCNNMMFKYEDAADPKKPTEVCLLDFQLSRVGSLVLDLSYFFYACASEECIEKFHYYMEDVYYKTLEKQLKEYDIDAKTVYPIEKLREEFKTYGLYGFHFATMVVKLALSDADEVPDISELTENMQLFDNKVFRSQKKYESKMKAIVKHLIKNNLF